MALYLVRPRGAANSTSLTGGSLVYSTVVPSSSSPLSITGLAAGDHEVFRLSDDPLVVSVASTALTIGGSTAVSVLENTTVVATYTASRAATWSLSGTDAALFAIPAGPSTTAALAFAGARNFEDPKDAGSNNIYDVTVVAADGAVSASRAVAVTVTDVAEAPDTFAAAGWSLADSPSTGGDKLLLTIITLPATNGAALSKLQYRIGTGAASDLTGLGVGAQTITVLAGAAASVSVRAVSAAGDGAWSTVKTATPTVASRVLDPEAPDSSLWISPTNLNAAITAMPATGGTIWLQDADYGATAISNRQFTSPLVLRSAVLSRFARFLTRPSTSAGVTHAAAIRTLNGTSGVHVLNCDASHTPTDTSLDYEKIVTFEGGSNVRFVGGTVRGGNGLRIETARTGAPNGPNYGYGISYGIILSDCSDFLVAPKLVETVGYGVILTRCSNGAVRGAEIRDQSKDAIQGYMISDVEISGNYCHSSRRSLALDDFGNPLIHADLLQIFQNDTVAGCVSRRIAIWANRLERGQGPWTQAILIGSERYSDTKLASDRNEDFFIGDNYVFNSHKHSITVGGVLRVDVVGNTVLHNTDGIAADEENSAPTPAINLTDCTTGTVANNLARAISVASSCVGIAQANNIIIQRTDSAAANYYGELLVDSLGTNRTLAQMAAKPGSIIYTTTPKVGSHYSRPLDPVLTLPALPWAPVDYAIATETGSASVTDLATTVVSLDSGVTWKTPAEAGLTVVLNAANEPVISGFASEVAAKSATWMIYVNPTWYDTVGTREVGTKQAGTPAPLNSKMPYRFPLAYTNRTVTNQ